MKTGCGGSEGSMERKRMERLIRMWGAPLIVALILAAVYYRCGIYPFGTGTIAQGDVEGQYASYCIKVWDWLHGTGSPELVWELGIGLGFWPTVAQYTLITPLNLLLLLFPKEGIFDFVSIVSALKLILCAVTASYVFSRRFEKLPTFWVVFLSAAYGLSGYALRQYHNFMWFEPVILLPLLLFYAERALRGKRVLPYALILGLSLILNLYITAMVCLYVFFAAGMYILLILKKEERGRATLRFALATVAALLISAFMTVPMLLALQTSARHGIESEIALFEAFRGFDAESGLILYSLTFAVPILLPYLFKALRGKRWREGLYHAGMLFIILAPLFFRGLSEVWHFGRYICYPNRFGFLMVFTILLACACALEQNERDGAQKWASDGRRKSIIMSVGALLLVLLFVRLCILGGDEYDELFMAGRKGYVWMTVIGVLAYTAILAVPFRRLANAMLALVLCAQIGTYSLSAYRQGADSSELNALRVMTLSDRFADRAPTERVCRKRDGAVVGFGPYLGVAEVGAYNSMLSGTYMSAMKTLLYGTTIAGQHNEQGGTLFSDALLGVTAVIAPENAFDETDSAYTRVAARSGIGVFECRYTLPFGIMGDAGLLEPLNAEMPADKQNAVFSALGGGSRIPASDACMHMDTGGKRRVELHGKDESRHALLSGKGCRQMGGAGSRRAERRGTAAAFDG